MPKPINNRSKDPAKWSSAKLIQELERDNPAAVKYMQSDGVKGMSDRVRKSLKKNKGDFESLVDRVVPGYSERSGLHKKRGLVEFWARVANKYGYRPDEILEAPTFKVAGLVDAMDATTPDAEQAGEWIGPISKSAMARRIRMQQSARWRDVEVHFADEQVKLESRQRFSFDISGLSELQKTRARTPRPGERS